MFGPLSNYLQEQDLDRGKCIGVCTERDAGIIGRLSGITVKIREKANKDLSIHCIINQEPISVTKLSPELNDIMNGTVEIVSGIRGRALHSRLYEARSNGVGSLHHRLLFHAEIWWLSRARVLKRLLELRKESSQFLRERNSPLKELLFDKMWKGQLAYSADVFSLLNVCNSAL